MAISYADIGNGETGFSIRTKINGLGANVVNLSTAVDAVLTEVDTVKTDISSINSIIDILDAKSHQIGFADYNDSATQTTPLSVIANTQTDITNDGLGAYSNTAYLPSGVTKLWDTTTQLFDFSELSLGDTLDIRLDLEVTTTSISQEVNIVLELGTNTTPYEVLFTTSTFKTTGSNRINRYNGIYIGNTDTINGGGKFKILSDDDCTVKVNGWYIRVTKG